MGRVEPGAGQPTATPEPCPQPDDPTDTDAWFTAFALASEPRVAVGVLLVASGGGRRDGRPCRPRWVRAALGR